MPACRSRLSIVQGNWFESSNAILHWRRAKGFYDFNAHFVSPGLITLIFQWSFKNELLYDVYRAPIRGTLHRQNMASRDKIYGRSQAGEVRTPSVNCLVPKL
jgi:hypothetical protein